jgi:hypothetical protein
MDNLGKLAKDKITGFEGIIVGKIVYLFGCNQYGLAPRNWDKEKGKRPETEYFDAGRVEIVGEGVNPADVQGEDPGGENNFDTPKV